MYYSYCLKFLLSATLFIIISIYIILKFTPTINHPNEDIQLKNLVEWQIHSKGIICTATKIALEHKLLLTDAYFNIYSKQTNAIVVGSSTVMGIREGHFAKPVHIFNLAKNSYFAPQTILEALRTIIKFPTLKWVIMESNWSFGITTAFAPNASSVANILQEEMTQQQKNSKELSYYELLQDLITLQRVKIVLRNIYFSIIRSGNDIYICPGEKEANCIDYKADAPRKGAGFRWDGSHTLGNHRNYVIGNNSTSEYIEKFSATVKKSCIHEINKEYFRELKKIARILQVRGGNLILLFSPMSPNIEYQILTSTVGGKIKQYKKSVSNWATRTKVKLVDAGGSEKYGCSYDEFYDDHHALDSCYSKIWRQEDLE